MSFPTKKAAAAPTALEIWDYVTRKLTNLDDVRAALIDEITAVRMEELDAANLPSDVDDVKSETDKIPAVEHETEWTTDPNVDSVSSAAEANLTEGVIDTVDYPTGATEVRVILLPILKAANQSGATHHIGLTVQYREDDGTWTDIIDLTTDPPMCLVVLDGAGDTFAQPLDVSAIVESGKKYEFRFQVDSDDAGEVHYTSSFVLILVYTMG